jgi:hypothetical protein
VAELDYDLPLFRVPTPRISSGRDSPAVDYSGGEMTAFGGGVLRQATVGVRTMFAATAAARGRELGFRRVILGAGQWMGQTGREARRGWMAEGGGAAIYRRSAASRWPWVRRGRCV